MANEIVPLNMSKALDEIDRLRALIVWRCTRYDIRLIHEPLKKDIADLRAAVDALEYAFKIEGTNQTAPSQRVMTKRVSVLNEGSIFVNMRI